MDFASRLPTEESSHFPINEPNDPIIVHNAIGLGKVVMHEAHVRVGIAVKEKDLQF
jgi:hypothetical protein